MKKILEFLKRYKLRNYDFILVFLVVSLSIVGVVAVSSSDVSLQNKQITGIVLGCIVMIIVSLLDYSKLLNFYWAYYILAVLLLLGVLVFGSDSHGAQRWLEIAGITFQPSEISKILIILFYAKFIMVNQKKVKTMGFLFSAIGLLIPPILLILKEPDLSTTIMLCTIFAMILFVGGISWKLVAGVLLAGIPSAALIFYLALLEDSPILKSYQQERILAWLHPEDFADTTAYQTMNSMMAIGSGQLQGKGYDTNEISSVLNSGYISESSTDFIFTVIGEEFGFIGSCIVVFLLVAITIKCLITAARAKDIAGSVIATGMAVWIGFQGLLNIGVATGALPNTGIPLPLVSSGLTSIVSVYIGVGFVLNVGLQQLRKSY
jgi:rod shape determining protein RodA